MKELATVRVPFRLRHDGGLFSEDDVVGNYNIVVLREGVPFVCTPSVVSLGALGRHLLVFQGGTEAQYQVFIDHLTPGWSVSVESVWVYLDRYLTGDIVSMAQEPVHIADAVWNALVAGHVGAGTTGAFLRRCLQLAEPDVTINPTTGQVVLRDRATGEVLLTYAVGGVIDSRVTSADG